MTGESEEAESAPTCSEGRSQGWSVQCGCLTPWLYPAKYAQSLLTSVLYFHFFYGVNPILHTLIRAINMTEGVFQKSQVRASPRGRTCKHGSIKQFHHHPRRRLFGHTSDSRSGDSGVLPKLPDRIRKIFGGHLRQRSIAMLPPEGDSHILPAGQVAHCHLRARARHSHSRWIGEYRP